MRALVTGAGGFVGANLVRYLMATDYEPVSVVRPCGDRWRLDDLAGEVAIVEVDLRDLDAVRRVVSIWRPELIFHLAAFGAYSWQSSFDRMVAINLLSTDALLEAARSADSQVVIAGSSSEYGYQDHAPSELERLEPNSHYAVTKAAGSHLCRFVAAKYGQRAVTLRLYSVYGPWEDPRRLMPTLVARALQDSWPPLVAPATARDFIWIGDVCAAFVAAATVQLDDPGSVFNIASGTQTMLTELVAIAQRLFSVSPEPVWDTMPGRDWDTRTWIGDPSCAERLLGWRAETSLRDGLLGLADWLRARPSFVERHWP